MDAFIQRLAWEAGERVWQSFDKVGKVQRKGTDALNVVTRTDVAVEKYIVSAIKKAYPTHGILAEESGRCRVGGDDQWVIDPLDGTLNFAIGEPTFGTMIAHTHKGELEHAAIYIPSVRRLYFAQKGRGTFLNGKRLHCANTQTLSRSCGIVSASLGKLNAPFIERLCAYDREHPIHLNIYGSMVASCYVAAGRRDWLVMFASSWHDLAAPALIMREAGCKVTHIDGSEPHCGGTGIVASTPTLHDELLSFVRT